MPVMAGRSELSFCVLHCREVFGLGSKFGFKHAPGGAQWANRSVLSFHNSVFSSLTPDPKCVCTRSVAVAVAVAVAAAVAVAVAVAVAGVSVGGGGALALSTPSTHAGPELPSAPLLWRLHAWSICFLCVRACERALTPSSPTPPASLTHSCLPLSTARNLDPGRHSSPCHGSVAHQVL
jgi:hypothetical protein